MTHEMKNVKALSINPDLPVIKYYDPQIDVGKPRVYRINQGGVSKTVQAYTASSANNSNITFNCALTGVGSDVVLCEQMYIALNPAFDLGGAGATEAYQATKEGFRAYPLHNSSETASLTIDSWTSSWQPQKVMSAMSLYRPEQETEENMIPSLHDQFQRVPIDATSAGFQRNVFRPYSDNISRVYNEMTRHIGNYAGTLTGTTINGYITEPVINPALDWIIKSNSPGFIGAKNLSLTYNYNFSRFWQSGAVDPAAPTTYSRTISNFDIRTPTLYLTFIQLPAQYVMNIPRFMSKPIFNVQIYTSSNTSSITTTGALVSSVIPINTVVNRLYIYARPEQQVNATYRPQLLSCGASDTFAIINSVNITFGTYSGILSSYNSSDLYALSRRNGMANVSWTEWSCGMYRGRDNYVQPNDTTNPTTIKGVGSVLCITSNDLPIQEFETAGSISKTSLQVTLSIANPLGYVTGGALPVDYMLYVVPCTEEVLTYDRQNDTWWVEKGIITPEIVMNAPIAHANDDDYKIWGGSFFSRLKSIGSTIVRHIPSALKVIGPALRSLAPLVRGIAPDPRVQGVAAGAESIGNVLGRLGYGRKGGRRLSIRDVQ